MSKLYIFFPHCYVKATTRELLVYDTLTFEHIYMKDVILSKLHIDMLNQFGCFEEDDDTKPIARRIEGYNLGYHIQYKEQRPYIPERKLRIATSLDKERKALGHNLTANTNMMLKSLTILLNNTTLIALNTLAYNQLDYPEANSSDIDLKKICVQLSPFFLESITLSGELPYNQLEKFLLFTQGRRIQVIYRIHYLAYPFQYIQELLYKFKTLIIEVLFDSYIPYDFIKSKEKRLFFKYIITSSNIDMVQETRSDVIICPVFLDTKTITLQAQMILTENEIFQSRQSLKECYIKENVNPTCFGHLNINYNGDVHCFTQKIGSLQNEDLPHIINKWVGSKNCLWYLTRKEKESCKNCALQALCPPISIYEYQHIYKSPCMV